MIIRCVFMGTSGFAVPIVKALFCDDRIELIAVITQPDRPAGRGHRMQSSAVKQWASEQTRTLPIFTPMSAQELTDILTSVSLDCVVVASYGMIVPDSVLNVPRSGCINVHASLLPKYRGASPIQSALLNGDAKTGITWILMDNKMDHGSILLQKNVPIQPNDTTPVLSERLSSVASDITADVVCGVVSGAMMPHEQNHAHAIYTQKITKEMGIVDWEKDAEEIARMVRALYPWPGAVSFFRKKRLLIQSAHVLAGHDIPQSACGTVFLSHQNFPAVVCGNNSALELEKIQIEGKALLWADVFLRGYQDMIGTILG